MSTLKNKCFLGLYVLLLMPWLGWAANIEVTSVSGASNWEATGDEGEITIYGGLAGNCTGNGQQTCNSCAAQPGPGDDFDPATPENASVDATCNENRIYDNLQLVIYFQANTQLTVAGKKLKVTSGTQDTNVARGTFSQPTLNPGGQAHYAILWSNVCGGTSCTGSRKVELNIGVDADDDGLDGNEELTITIVYYEPNSGNETEANTITCEDNEPGICSFSVERGHEKVFLGEVILKGDTPYVPFESARVFFVENNGGECGYADINYTTGTSYYRAPTSSAPAPTQTDPCRGGNDYFGRYEDFSFEGDTLGHSIITELTNGKIYAFKMAMIDKAHNIAFLTSNTQIYEITRDDVDKEPLCPRPDTRIYDLRQVAACPYLASPEETLGFLSEKRNCFIATAAVGSSQAWQVQVLRQFRDQVLTRYDFGRAFINWYYRYGPIGAQFLEKHPIFKPLVRIVLWPIVGLAWSSLQWIGDE